MIHQELDLQHCFVLARFATSFLEAWVTSRCKAGKKAETI
jgi:hypothetical protein